MSRSPRILSVEIDASLLRTRTVLLESVGYSVCEAGNCEQALAGLGSQIFDILIVGHELSDSHRQQLVEAAKKANPAMAVVVLQTSIGSESVRPTLGTRNVDSHQPDKLLDTVGELWR